MRTILLGLNELNFKLVEKYIQLGELPHFKKLFTQYGYSETQSEQEYALLEPWIQWVTIQTGKTYAQHQIYRLGDITQRPDLPQVFELLEIQGYKVAAVSPMNAENRLQNPSFFIPDPWTNTPAAGNLLVKNLSRAIVQAVNDNAQGKLSISSFIILALSMLYYTPATDYAWYLQRILELKKKIGGKMLILDKLLSDVFICEWKKSLPDFALLFLNGAAHLQHHYLFNACVYSGEIKNPEWYCPPNQDPILAIYQLYDMILGELTTLPHIRLLIATGLSQQPHAALTYYWRLKHHAQFLHLLGINEFTRVHPRMSRDFLIEFPTTELAAAAAKKLLQLQTTEEKSIFYVDNRGHSLFVELIYAEDITETTTLQLDNMHIANFKHHVAFVAIKNGEHNATGYYLDTTRPSSTSLISLTQIYTHILQDFDISS